MQETTSSDVMVSPLRGNAFSELSGNSKVLAMILSFLDPDHIDEHLLEFSAYRLKQSSLKFMKNNSEFLDAQVTLLQGDFTERLSENGIIPMRRHVQNAVIHQMSTEERQEALSLAVAILAANFPDTHSADVGHQAASWAHCARSLPHVGAMLKKSEEFQIFENANQPFAELLLRCSWYLYEREDYIITRSYIDGALKRFSSKDTLACASAIDLRGLIHLDICHFTAALEVFEEAFKIRTMILPDGHSLLAASLVNIGLALTELGELGKAQEYLQQSIRIRLMHNSDRIGNSYSNMASLLLRMGRVDQAEAMLKSCPSLKDFSDETFLRTENPRFSGDMVLLSKIRFAQGVLDEALRLASKALGFRRVLLDERLKICDSLYQVASLHCEAENMGLARELLQKCIGISENLPLVEGIGHLARANYKLSRVLGDAGMSGESKKLLDRAVSLRRDIKGHDPDFVLVNGIESDFGELVPWMLW